MVLLVFGAVALRAPTPWYRSQPTDEPIYGIDFSCQQAEWLGEDCQQAYLMIMDQMHVRHVRLSAYWDQIEPEQGVLDFSTLDWEIAEAASHGAYVTLSVGMKAQRAPEYYLPKWIRAGRNIPEGSSPAADPTIAAATLDFVRATVQHESGQSAIEAWQVENEPYVHFWRTAHDWSLPSSFVNEEADAIRSLDPEQRPLLITHASWLRTDGTWKQILHSADIVGEAVYTKRQRGPLGGVYLYPFQIGPLTPNLPGQEQAAARQGKALWISELQAEPFEAPWVDLRNKGDCTFPSMSPALLKQNIQLAERSGAQRAYFWGAEWWYFCLTKYGDDSLWKVAQQALQASEARELARGVPQAAYSSACLCAFATVEAQGRAPTPGLWDNHGSYFLNTSVRLIPEPWLAPQPAEDILGLRRAKPRRHTSCVCRTD